MMHPMTNGVSTKNERILEKLEENCINLIKVAFELANVNYVFKGDYSSQDLISLEQCFNALYPKKEHPPLLNSFIPIGFYLGETLVRNITGASWVLQDVDEGDLFEIKVAIPFGNSFTQIYPFKWVRNFWFQRESNFVDLYHTCKNAT